MNMDQGRKIALTTNRRLFPEQAKFSTQDDFYDLQFLASLENSSMLNRNKRKKERK